MHGASRWTWLAFATLVACGTATTTPCPTPPPTSSPRPREAIAAGPDSAPCAPPREDEPRVDFGPKPLMAICHGVYVDPAMAWEDREQVKVWYGEAHAEVARFFEAPLEAPNAIVCVSDACVDAFAGPTKRSRATMRPRPTVIVVGVGPLTKGTLVHEMIHVEIAHRLGERRAGRDVPAWFVEGVATFIGDNVRCAPAAPPAVDDLRRLAAPYAWTNFTNQPDKIGLAYCQARDEIGAWASTHGKRALASLVDAVARGESFEAGYGPLAIAPARPGKPALVASFALDETSGDAAADAGGRLAPASLAAGARRTAGHRGGGVAVSGGGYLRAGGFAQLGLPDTPFSIALWVKPRANAKVLVHSAMRSSGGDGWCVPMLGHDAAGHLVAQITFDAKPSAFLSATGPTLPLERWSHVAMTWAADDGVRLYVDGKLAASGAPKDDRERSRDAPGSPMHLLFGGQAGGRCWPGAIESGDWNGALDEIRVFDYALSADDVADEARR